MEARQLHLFKGKRQRGLKPPPPKEFLLHCAVADVIRRWGMPGWIYTHIGHGEYRTPHAAARLKRMGLVPGFPDFVFLHESGAVYFLELKRRGGHLSDAQRVIAAFLQRAGHGYVMTDSFDIALSQLMAWGVVRTGVHPQ